MRACVAIIALALSAVITPALAQNYPSRTITLIVPFPPGGSTDVAGRILAEKMGAALGQPVIVENVGGAGGSLGVGRLARAAPDGYTIDIGQWDTHVGSIIYNLNYDLQRDFAPIGLVSLNPMLLVAKKTLPADDLKSLAGWMKAHPGDAKFVNQNASAQVGGLLLEKLTGSKVLFVPYRGAGPAMTDLISGQVDLLLVQGAVALPQVRAGTIKALAELSPQRSASMPDIASADESGAAGLYISGWFGLFAPKATPAAIVAKLNAAMVQALADQRVRERFATLGLDVASAEQQTPAGLAAFHKTQMVADHQGGGDQRRVEAGRRAGRAGCDVARRLLYLCLQVQGDGMAEQMINDVPPDAPRAATPAPAAVALQPELLTAYRLMLEYQFFGAICLIVILGVGLLSIYLMRFDPPILGLVALAGVLGAFFSALTRLYNVDQASIALISPTVSKLGGRYLLMYPLVPPIVGAIASVVIYVIFIAGLVGDGGIFPQMTCKTQSCDSLLTMLRDFGPKGAPDYGKALVWAFAAGFSERLVPDSIQTLIAKMPKD